MANSIYITAVERGCGKSAISLGLINLLERKISKVAYFKPIGQAEGKDGDHDVRLMKEALGLSYSVQEMTAVTMDEVTSAVAQGKYDQLLDRIMENYHNLAAKADFIVVEGTDYFGAMSALEFNINADLSKNLGAPILLVANACSCIEQGNCEPIVKNLSMIKGNFDEKGCQFLGAIINRVDMEQHKANLGKVVEALNKNNIQVLGSIPRVAVLENINFEEVARNLKAEVISGKDNLQTVSSKIIVGAMTLENVLSHLTQGALVITPGDREDVILGMAAAYNAQPNKAPSGVVMSGGLEPRPNIKQQILDLTKGKMPILKTSTTTYETAITVHETIPMLCASQETRMQAVKTSFEQNVNISPVLEHAQVKASAQRMTPKQFLYKIVELARRDKKHIVLPEGLEERIIRAADDLLERKIVDVTLLGPEAEITQKAKNLGLKLNGAKIIDPATTPLREKFAKRYMELRAKKNPTYEQAFDLMGDSSYFGTMMVQEKMADGMVSGSINTTAHTLRPALEFVKTKEGISLASSIFFMCLPDSVLVYGDCAVNPNPTAAQLAEIAIASADTSRAFDVEPLVAMLSYSTGDSGTGADVDKVREATKLVKERRPDIAVEGPIQYDAAIDAGVAKTKLPKSPVAGKATVFIFPDLNTGNNTYKAVQRSANALAIGPVMQGLRKPVNDLSRGCTVPDIINTVIITAIQAQRN